MTESTLKIESKSQHLSIEGGFAPGLYDRIYIKNWKQITTQLGVLISFPSVCMTESTLKIESKSQLAVRQERELLGLYDRIYIKNWKQITTKPLVAHHSTVVCMTESTLKIESKSQPYVENPIMRSWSVWPNLH